MHKKSLGGKLSINPVRTSLIEKEDRRRTQTLKSGAASVSEESLIPRPRVRSSSADTNNRKSGLKPPAIKVQLSQYGYNTPQRNAVTPSTSRSRNTARSLCPGSVLRGRSLSAERASNVSSNPSRKDNRPLGEKSFQTEMLNKIDSYLQSIQQTNLLNANGSVRPITLKIFVEASNVLVGLLDVRNSLTILNYVEELPKIAKKLHYPGQMNKSWLKTANAMHSWPQVLGWLSWLAELCQAKDVASEYLQLENLPFIETEDRKDFNRMTFQFLLDAYKAWNEEKSNEETAATEDYLIRVAAAYGVSQEIMDNMKTECEQEALKLEQEKAECHALDDELKQLEDTLKDFKNKKAQQDDYLKELEGAKEKYLLEAKQLDEESNILYDTLQQRKQRYNELKIQVKSQPMSVVERDEIVENCSAMQNQMHELDKHLNDLEKEIYTLDIQLASTRNNLNKLVFAYNKDIYLHLGKEADIDLCEIAMPLTGISNPNVMDELHRKADLMTAFHENIKKRIKSAESKIQVDQKMLDTLGKEKMELEQEKENRFSKINENKDRIKVIEETTKMEEYRLKESIKDLKNNMEEILDKMPNIELEEQEVAEVKDKLEAVKRRKAYLEESARLFFDKFYEILANHRNKLAEVLKDA